MSKLFSHSYILFAVLLTVYSQLIMRWQASAIGQLPNDIAGKIHFIVILLLNPWVVTGLIATFLAGVSWLLAMTRFEISYAFPFMGLVYVLILAAGVILFNESVTTTKLLGTIIVVIGIIIVMKG